MHTFAISVAVFAGLFFSLIAMLVLILPKRGWLDRARERRLADAKMNARLLRFNL